MTKGKRLAMTKGRGLAMTERRGSLHNSPGLSDPFGKLRAGTSTALRTGLKRGAVCRSSQG